ncbi:MAG: hypothetical protein V4622_08530 [Bacteroidota bacterium]
MKSTTLILFLLLLQNLIAKDVDSLFVDKTKLYFHHVRAKANESLVIHLHGSVSEFKKLTENKIFDLDTLLENNNDFIHEFTKAGFDVLVPQAFQEYNWLEEKGKVFIDKLIEKYGKLYSSLYISGFSDGGTGAYRIFYQNPEKFSGLIAFNAYPQMNYFNKTVDYKKVTNKKVIYFSQKNDHLIPYEFLLMEYRRQKLVNNETYFYLKEGKHEFIKYSKKDFEDCTKQLLQENLGKENKNDFVWIYAPIDALILDHEILELYTFRKAIGKKFGIDIKEYMSQVESKKTIGKIIKEQNSVRVMPILVSKNELETLEIFEFNFVSRNESYSIIVDNYFKIENW